MCGGILWCGYAVLLASTLVKGGSHQYCSALVLRAVTYDMVCPHGMFFGDVGNYLVIAPRVYCAQPLLGRSGKAAKTEQGKGGVHDNECMFKGCCGFLVRVSIFSARPARSIRLLAAGQYVTSHLLSCLCV